MNESNIGFENLNAYPKLRESVYFGMQDESWLENIDFVINKTSTNNITKS